MKRKLQSGSDSEEDVVECADHQIKLQRRGASANKGTVLNQGTNDANVSQPAERVYSLNVLADVISLIAHYEEQIVHLRNRAETSDELLEEVAMAKAEAIFHDRELLQQQKAALEGRKNSIRSEPWSHPVDHQVRAPFTLAQVFPDGKGMHLMDVKLSGGLSSECWSYLDGCFSLALDPARAQQGIWILSWLIQEAMKSPLHYQQTSFRGVAEKSKLIDDYERFLPTMRDYVRFWDIVTFKSGVSWSSLSAKRGQRGRGTEAMRETPVASKAATTSKERLHAPRSGAATSKV